MMHLASLAVVALCGVAQSANVHVVKVGADGMNKTGNFYSPDKIKVATGDQVQFQFWEGNHTVTQSNFDDPCVPISRSNASATAFSSGFMPAAASKAKGEIPVFTITIQDASPLWFYCGQARHCQGGMIMSINENPSANATRTLENLKARAANAPGEGGSTNQAAQGAPSPGGNGDSSTSAFSNANTTSAGAVSAPGPNYAAAAPTVLLALGAAFMLL